MRYEQCPHFGQKDCCGTQFKKVADRIQNITVVLDTKTGEKIEAHPWQISQEQEFPDMWTALRLTTPDYEDIDVSRLTQGSRHKYASCHHSGIITVYKSAHCPFSDS